MKKVSKEVAAKIEELRTAGRKAVVKMMEEAAKRTDDPTLRYACRQNAGNLKAKEN